MNRHPSFAFIAAASMLAAPLSFAHGNGSHSPKAHPYVASEVVDTAFGRQGDPKKVVRTIQVDMSDHMRFTPEVLVVKRGETVRLAVVNQGRLLHELVLGEPEGIRTHWQAMKEHPGMEHRQPHMVHVEAGRKGEMVWQFTQAGEFQFACLLPGHFEAGMAGKVVVR